MSFLSRARAIDPPPPGTPPQRAPAPAPSADSGAPLVDEDRSMPSKDDDDGGRRYGSSLDLLAPLPPDATLEDKLLRRIATCQESFIKHHYIYRLIIMAVAISLLWLTSLALVRVVVNSLVVGPDLNAVLVLCQAAIDKVNFFKEGFLQCTDRLVQGCKDEMISAVGTADATLAAAEAYNAMVINQSYTIRDGCAQDVAFVTNAFQLIVNVTQQDPRQNFSTNATYTDPRCNLVAQQISGHAGAMQAYGQSQNYLSATNQQLSEQAAAIKALQDYNAQYQANKTLQLQLIANQTLPSAVPDTSPVFLALNQSRDMYLACLAVDTSVPVNGQTCPQAGVLEQASQMVTAIMIQYNNIRSTAQAWNASAQDKINQVNGFYQSLLNNAALQGAIDAILILQGTSLAGLGFSPSLGFPDVFGDIGNLITQDLNAIYAQQQAQADAYTQSVIAQQKALIYQRQQLIAAQLGLVANQTKITGPYLPPPINTTADLQTWNNANANFLPSMSSSLNSSTAQSTATASYQQAQANLTVIGANYSSLLQANILARPYNFYVYPGFTLFGFEALWNYLISLATGFDTAYRVIRTVMIIRKYWRVSSMHTPPADVRVDHMQNYGLYSNQQNFFQRIAMILANPMFQCLVLTIIFGFICASFVTLYLPIYTNWVIGCVDQPSSGAGPGSLLSNNIYNISLEYAFADGDIALNKGVDNINVYRDQSCQRNVQAAENQYTSDVNQWNFVSSKLSDLQYDAYSYAICLNMTEADKSTQGNLCVSPTACFVANKGNCTNLVDVSPGYWCSIPLPPLVNYTYNCTTFQCSTLDPHSGQPACDTTYPSSVISNFTWEASCQAEWWFHANFLGSMMVIMMYILINISRILFVRGMARIMWRHVTDHRFAYLGTCDRSGELKFPSVITEQNWSMKRAIRESLAVRIRNFECRSLLLTLFALSLNVPYIVFLVILNKTMSPITRPLTA